MAAPPIATLTLDEIAALPRGARLMGLDLGTKTIGLALTDVDRRIATPLDTVRRTKFRADAEEVLRHAGRHGVAALVLGLPLNMDGSEGQRVQSTKAFARNLAAMTPLPIVFWDERLSTAAVTRALIEADASRARRGEVVDRMAAAYIVQGLLDRIAAMARAQAERDGDSLP
ncbi:MAG: Holliday junction resolvase RuvX [Burkholderiales bacterium]|nr:Holliday junction resolvase RuvX [Burkholderiales bacterium]